VFLSALAGVAAIGVSTGSGVHRALSPGAARVSPSSARPGLASRSWLRPLGAPRTPSADPSGRPTESCSRSASRDGRRSDVEAWSFPRATSTWPSCPCAAHRGASRSRVGPRSTPTGQRMDSGSCTSPNRATAAHRSCGSSPKRRSFPAPRPAGGGRRCLVVAGWEADRLHGQPPPANRACISTLFERQRRPAIDRRGRPRRPRLVARRELDRRRRPRRPDRRRPAEQPRGRGRSPPSPTPTSGTWPGRRTARRSRSTPASSRPRANRRRRRARRASRTSGRSRAAVRARRARPGR
jgi:hypothetical protein